MDPVFIHVFGRPIYWYGVMVALGFLATITHWNFISKREGYPPGFGADFGLLIMFTGILGARMAYVLANWADYAADPLSIIRIDQGGLIFYGGFILGSLSIMVFACWHKKSILHLGDFATSALPLGHALGRIGCFLNHCCYGAVTDFPLRVCQNGECRHPVQLYETAVDLAIYLLLAWRHTRKKRDGELIALYLMLYPTWRFFAEFMRGDPREKLFVIDVAQGISLALAAGGVLLWFLLPNRKQQPDHAH